MPTPLKYSGQGHGGIYNNKMTTVTEDGGRTNLYATEPQMYIDPETMKENYETHNEKAEKLNGRAAMMGIIAALGSYAVTGQIIPGLW